jgi:hypothetical protein
MNRKLASIILLVALVAIALVAALPAAAEEHVNVDPVYEMTYQVSTEDTIHLYYWLWTTTPGHVNVYLKGNETSYTLRNAANQIVWSLTAEAAVKYWSDIFKVDFSSFLITPCRMFMPQPGNIHSAS